MSKKLIFKITFLNHEKVYEIYAKYVNQSGLIGFVEIEGLIFGEKSDLLIDPAEEHLKTEFSGVERFYIPMHSVIRIDEVEKRGACRITPVSSKKDNVTRIPLTAVAPNRGGDS